MFTVGLYVKINKITVVTIVTEETNNIHGSLSVILLSRLFIKKNIDVNEHERRFTFTHIKVKDDCFYCCSTFHSH
jgi:hypothetical protein